MPPAAPGSLALAHRQHNEAHCSELAQAAGARQEMSLHLESTLLCLTVRAVYDSGLCRQDTRQLGSDRRRNSRRQAFDGKRAVCSY